MEMDQLTDEQIANLTPEQIEMLENEPGRLVEILGEQAVADEPRQEEGTGAPGGRSGIMGEDEPVVLNKSGKGTIPYEKHKELRVENSALREQLKSAQMENSKVAEKLGALLKKKITRQVQVLRWRTMPSKNTWSLSGAICPSCTR